MPKYRFKCDMCGREYWRYKRMEARDEPEFCVHMNDNMEVTVHAPMTRIFTASFQIIAEREADKRDNDLYRILTRNGTQADRLEMMRKDEARQERTNREMESFASSNREVTVDEIVGDLGLGEAARSGEIGIQNWREQHIPKEEAASV